MATAKAERLLNLVIALANTKQFRTAQWVRERVAGYSDAPSEEAFFRTFERDKQELRDLGIPLQTGGDDGYRILPGEMSLPELDFTPAETAAVGLAARLWATSSLAGAGAGAVRKLRDSVADTDDVDALDFTAGSLLQTRVRTTDPAFQPLLGAVQRRAAVSFDYRKDPIQEPVRRRVLPWGLVSFRGRWYLVGHDLDRADKRTFRLSRIAGKVDVGRKPGAFEVPEGIDLLELVSSSVDRPDERTAVVRIRQGRAAGLRRWAKPATEEIVAAGVAGAETRASAGSPAGDDDFERCEIPLGHLWDTARQISAQGPDIVVESPPDLVDAVVRLLTASGEVNR